MQTLRARPIRRVIELVLVLLLLGAVAFAAGKLLAYTVVPQTDAALPSAIPDPSTVLPAAGAPVPTSVPTALEMPCVESHDVQLCVLSATQSAGKTSILVKVKSLGGQLTPGSVFPGQLLWQDEGSLPTLLDGQGNTLSLDTGGPDQPGMMPLDGSPTHLTFIGTPADGQPVKLSLPGFFASMPVDQTVSVDLGKDPQPGTLPVNSDIQVFGQTVRFRNGTLLGDSTSSLRLYLKSESVAILDGVEPYLLELGRPDRVDDLYGAGPLTGKGLFVELFQYSKKLTGKLDLPIVKATAVIHGPFEFTLAVLPAAPETATPPPATPAPTATPLALDSYAYTGQSLSPGDLVYTVLADGNSQVLAFTPGTDKQSRLVVILPGAVAQIYIHPDRLGMDYLAGSQVEKDHLHYIDTMRLYTLRFSDPAPRLLYSFAPNPDTWEGTTVTGDWSFDGRYAVFSSVAVTPGISSFRYTWLDLSCRTQGDCAAHDLAFQSLLDISNALFSPDDYQILFESVDDPVTGKADIFHSTFDPQELAGAAVNLTANLALADGAIPPPAWTADKKIFTVCGDSVPSYTNTFCTIDPATGSVTAGKPISPNLKGYRLFGGLWVSPSGKQLAAIVFPVDATQASIPELRLLDMDGHLGQLIARSQSLVDNSSAAFSPSGRYVGYMLGIEQTVEIFDISSGQNIPVYHGAEAPALSWLGWVH